MAKWKLALAALCVLLVLVGWVTKLATRLDARDLYFGGFLALLALGTPGTPGPISRVLPFLLYYALVAVDRVGRWKPRLRAGVRRSFFVVLLGANLLGSLSLAGVHTWGLWTVDPSTDQGLARIYPDDWAVRIAAARRVADLAPAHARVLCRRGYAEVLHVLSGLRMVAMPKQLDAHALLAFAEDRADFVIAMRGRRRTDHLLWLVQRGRSPTLRVAFSLKSGDVEVFVLARREAGARGAPVSPEPRIEPRR